jgi:hypothetical protein
MATKTKQTAIEPITTELAVTAATRELTPAIWKMIEVMAPAMYKSHLFGVTSIEQAEAIMLKGFECGFSMTASFDFIQVIQGKPGVAPRGAMALLLSSPIISDIDIVRLEDKTGKFSGYQCTMKRTGKNFQHTARFTMEDATRAGLVKPDSGWSKYPENMCLWRAVGFAADVVAPDVTAGMTTLMKAPEMYGVALTEGGDVIDAVATSVPSVDPLQQLINDFGAEAIMNVNNGAIPTNGQIEEVRRKLLTQQAMVEATNRD